MPQTVEIAYDASPSVLVFADGMRERAEWRIAIEAAGASARSIEPVEAIARRSDHGSARAVALSFEGTDHAHLAETIAAAERCAEAESASLVVNVPPGAIDAAISAACDKTAIVSQPDYADRVIALSLALQGPRTGFAESAGADGLRLKRLADEVNRIARALSHLSATDAPARPAYEASPAVGDVQLLYLAPAQHAATGIVAPAEVRSTLRLRRLRDRFFPGDLFADPAWDMLLDLFAARMEGDNVAVSSLCIAAAVPPTTALRWIKTMTDEQLFERHADPMDGRRIFIRLSDRAMDGMQRFFAAANGQARTV